MVNDSKEKNQNYRTISQAFEELNQAKAKYETGYRAINQDRLSFKQWLHYKARQIKYNKKEIKKFSLITAGVFTICTMVVSTNYIFAQYTKEEEIKQKIATNVFETNKESLNLQKIVLDNVDIVRSKTIVEDEPREVPFETKKQNNVNLPKGEEVVVQEGVLGTKLVDCVKSYEDDEYIEEKILDETVSVEPIPKIIDVGTSEILAKLQVHIGDIVYVNKNVNLKQTPSDEAENICIILDSLDVKLEELYKEEGNPEVETKWCKVMYGTYEGYLKEEDLTSSALTPGISEKNRTQKLYATLDANMDLTKPSGLTLEDYKKVLSGNPLDTNKIIEDNAEYFYNAEQKYKVNGIFLASMAIHESAWGTSKIAREKKNLFGFGAYDRSPYESANTFDDYKDGIDAVAKYLAKNYLNMSGTSINETEVATGSYYYTPTISGVNTRYCTDKEWSTKIFKYMDMLYSRL